MIYNYIWYFFIYSFLGWCLEVIYASLEREDFINRGFLNGSYCPIYGFGAVCEIFLLTKFVNYPICLYIISVVITTVLEFITGYILEKIFNLQWWDYTNEKFNIKGYICLKFSLLWGVASLVLMYILQPKVNIIVSLLRHVDFVVYLLILLMLYDF
ncbi:putative ABC transporter permease [Sneathia vaginalis]|uniref:putative ABC transporter permease n=3 Tax=Sneathia TaxID=168808 RepID=UPI00254A5F70|nr:putative ABC transporter permease [Sneathia vaginalis]MDK9582214.1 putative ABC transporter permease [Sneathia vaginalis]